MLSDPSRGDRFEAAVLVHLDAAYNLARWLLNDAAAADDVVQDASLRAFRYFDGMHGPAPKVWFMAIVRNASLDWLGRHRHQRFEESYDEAAHARPGLDAHEQVDTPESMAIRADEVKRVRRCLARLSTEHREVIILRDIEEMSYRDIGTVVGVPIGTVMSRLARGREQLGRLLGADLGRRTS